MSISKELSAHIWQELNLLNKHPQIIEIAEPYWADAEKTLKATVNFRIELPSRKRANGVSRSGVRAVEQVTFVFPQTYPLHAPRIYLRNDFPRTFAHIQPGSSETPPEPCIFHGDLDELIHAQGLWGIANQLASWLQKAALDELIDPQQGWEPIRRDNLEDIVVADLAFLRSHCNRHKHYHFYSFAFAKHSRKIGDKFKKQFLLFGQIDKQPLRFSPKKLKPLWRSCTQIPRETIRTGRGVTILATPGKDSNGKPYIASHYEPEIVKDIQSLYVQAEKYGCYDSLKSAFSWLQKSVKPLTAKFNVPVVVILGARRPYSLINEPSNIELVAYWLEISFPDMLPQKEETPVYPLGLEQDISRDLLRTFADQPESLSSESIALVGCGSLGSKIAIHLARAGHAPGRVIDKRYLSPHNAARHALLPEMGAMQLDWQRQKASALVSAISSLAQETKDIHADASLVSHDSELRKKIFPNKVKVIVNATAAVTVREALAQLPTHKLAARVIETSLFANGQIGLMSVEGDNRNPNTLDLLALAFQLMQDDPKLRELVLQQPEAVQYQSTGQGCGSLTMRISDALISQFAASMTQGITSLLKDKVPQDNGHLFLGSLAQDSMSLCWQTHEVAPCQIVQAENSSGWHVRVSDRAHQKILAECSRFSTVETGGVLLGRISQSTQSFLVTDVMPAPSDSKRSPDQFVLGINGLQEAIASYVKETNGSLYCLGTWHSHIKLSGPSEQDYSTACILAKSQEMVSTLLIYTPTGYEAILTLEN